MEWNAQLRLLPLFLHPVKQMSFSPPVALLSRTSRYARSCVPETESRRNQEEIPSVVVRRESRALLLPPRSVSAPLTDCIVVETNVSCCAVAPVFVRL